MERELFQSLHNTEVGKKLVEYLKQVQKDACDARNWGPNDTKETAMMVSGLIQTKLIDKITLQNDSKKVEKNPFV